MTNPILLVTTLLLVSSLDSNTWAWSPKPHVFLPLSSSSSSSSKTLKASSSWLSSPTTYQTNNDYSKISSSSSLCLTMKSKRCQEEEDVEEGFQALDITPSSVSIPLTTLAFLLTSCTPAEASSGTPVIASAFAAYGHYLSLLIITGALMVERLTIKADMSLEEEQRMATADIIYGISGALLVFTGYLRVTQYGKGWEFYSHEPLFWLKILSIAVFSAVSFFPTTKIIQRSIAQRNGNFEPMSEKLASRMTSLMNAELLMMGSIPLLATLMSRGVGYAEWIPWQAEAALSAAVLLGLGGKYIKEALDFED